MIKRRQFIAGMGSAAAWPCVARAQPKAMPVIGFLHGGSPEVTPSLVAGFRKGLNDIGFIDGRNVTIDFRFAYYDNDRLKELAADLVHRQVDVIATPNSVGAALAIKAATTAIPIVFGSAGAEDPVKLGLVASYNRPGGNATGVTNLIHELGPKRLGLLHELVPNATRFALLVQGSLYDASSICGRRRCPINGLRRGGASWEINPHTQELGVNTSVRVRTLSRIRPRDCRNGCGRGIRLFVY
jgi:putative tryptophan/tyrosine transport system substrate-binding protein